MTTLTPPVDREDDHRDAISRALAIRSMWREGSLGTPEAWDMVGKTLGAYEDRRDGAR